MIGRYEAYMNGAALSAIDNSIVVLNVSHKSPRIQKKTNKVTNRHGARITRDYFGETSVTITFMIRDQNIVKRQEICQKVAQWAMQDGYLTTSDKRWKRLKCVCTEPPVIGSVLDWTSELTVGFTAYNPPFWQEVNPAVITLGGTGGATSGSGSAFIPGNVKETLLSVSITAKATLSSLTVTAGNTSIALAFPNNDKPASGDVITIDYDSDMILRIKKGSTSCLSYRTAASSDDLMCESGKTNTFSFTSSGKAIVTFTVRGWWI